MNEFEILSVLNSGLIANAIYGAGIFFILWVAFRAANQIRTEDSNIVILIVDSQYGPTSQDSKICSLIKKNNKGVIVVINKSDLIPVELNNERVISETILNTLTEISYAHTLLISALQSTNIDKIYKLIDEIETNLNKKVNTHNLNKYLKHLIERSTSPVNRGRRLKLYYATQTNSDTPSFVLF